MAKKKGPTLRRPTRHSQRRDRERPTNHRWLLAFAAIGVLAFAATVLALSQGDADEQSAPARDGDGPIHVHGLGVNPRDGALFIATHTGLWRVAVGERRPSRVTDRSQDTMGFTVVGPDRFLGSGHPDVRENLPPLLGLIESTDAGVSWQPISLLGQADFHVLRSKGKRVYGFDATSGRLMLSRDRGRTWSEREPPGALVDLAVHPTNFSSLIASGERGLLASRDEGKTWRPLGNQLGLLTWPDAMRLYLVDDAGTVSVSASEGREWTVLGDVGGRPAALVSSARDLYVALHDGSIKRSTDGGRTWTIRSSPA